MTITCDTSLDSILNFDDVNSIVGTMGSAIRDCTRPRLSTLEQEINTDAIKNGMIDDSNIMFSTGSDVRQNFVIFHRSLYNLEQEIRRKALEKEIQELEELISAIDKKISSLETEYNGVIAEMNSEDDPVKLYQLERSASNILRRIDTYENKKELAVERLRKRGVAPAADDAGDETAGSGGGSNPATLSHGQHTDYTLARGEIFEYEGKKYTVEFIGKDSNGNLYSVYSDETGKVHIMGQDGNLEATSYYNSQPYRLTLYEEKGGEMYDAYTTNAANAQNLGLPPADKVSDGPSDSMITYDPQNDTTYVDYGAINPNDVTHVTSSAELHDAAANHAPVITVSATQLEDNKNLWQRFLSGSADIDVNSGETQITLIYNQTTGKYYPVNPNGGYEMDMYAEYTPEALQNFTIEN